MVMWRGKGILGGCVVSSTQYASFVSAMIWSRHFTWSWRLVFSSSGGRGKLCTLSLGFGGISLSGLRRVGWSRSSTRVADRMISSEPTVTVMSVGL